MTRPIFVVGSMGSGTTLTRLMLDSHPHIMIAQETGFMRSVNAVHSIPFWYARDRWIKRIGLTRQELDRSLEAFYDDVFGRAAAKRGATRWGDKTPFHVEFIEAAARVFPEAQFVGTVRQPGAVANSVGRFGWNWRKGVRHWCRANEAILDAASVGDRLRIWRYEDLVHSTEEVMREVLEFVGEPWDPVVLEHHRHQSGRAEGGTVANQPVDVNRVGKWVEAATPEDLEYLDEMTGPLASFFGYDPRLSLPAGPIAGSVDGSLGASAGEWGHFDDVIATIPRHRSGRAFENSMYTQKDLALELGAAYETGRRGGRLRRPYSTMLPEEQGGTPTEKREPTPPPRLPFSRRVRRRVARLIYPGEATR